MRARAQWYAPEVCVCACVRVCARVCSCADLQAHEHV